MMTATIPLMWPAAPASAEGERVWLRVLAEHVARRLAADTPPEMVSGVLTARTVSRHDIRDAILESAEWETGQDGRWLAVHARCAVREDWTAESGDEGGWRRIWIRLTAEPADEGDRPDTKLTIKEEE